MTEEIHDWIVEVEQLQGEVARLRAALEWYSNRSNWFRPCELSVDGSDGSCIFYPKGNGWDVADGALKERTV